MISQSARSCNSDTNYGTPQIHFGRVGCKKSGEEGGITRVLHSEQPFGRKDWVRAILRVEQLWDNEKVIVSLEERNGIEENIAPFYPEARHEEEKKKWKIEGALKHFYG